MLETNSMKTPLLLLLLLQGLLQKIYPRQDIPRDLDCMLFVKNHDDGSIVKKGERGMKVKDMTVIIVFGKDALRSFRDRIKERRETLKDTYL